ncbi:DUF1161 domain-containing protein [Mitsuaria sp. WAJ17]|uniref:DUF1161 domain-containing protein n=1 Tax=Mitsuaria sp. WAJ17 TaxID=2761452 RepID=UPI001602D637|nr:DUF1161 domain-containing protein [Mitsuaria sp. WAJ17]MBB2487369.1 DUF1161 domain-containing protein [Mitsuaria sp. WAJ17]
MNKTLTLALLATVLATPALAAVKPCEELKAEIAAKLDEKGVKNYTLAVVESDKVGEAKVIGSCEGGSRKITYEKQ